MFHVDFSSFIFGHVLETFVSALQCKYFKMRNCVVTTNLSSAAAAIPVSVSARVLVRSLRVATADCVSASTSSVDLEAEVAATSEAAAWRAERSSSALSTSARIAFE